MAGAARARSGHADMAKCGVACHASLSDSSLPYYTDKELLSYGEASREARRTLSTASVQSMVSTLSRVGRSTHASPTLGKHRAEYLLGRHRAPSCAVWRTQLCCVVPSAE